MGRGATVFLWWSIGAGRHQSESNRILFRSGVAGAVGGVKSIQALRALAAIGVVIAHCAATTGPSDGRLGWAEIGTGGVDLFFVISGFIMTYVSWDAFGSRAAASDFLLRRLIRILPLYWLLTATLAGFGGYTVTHVAASFLFIPTSKVPVLYVGWTLNFEMMFYLTFSVFLLLPRKVGFPAIIAVLVAIAVSGIGAASGFPPPLNDAVVLEFAFGMIAGVLYFRGHELSLLVRIIVSVLAFYVVTRVGTHNALTFGVPAFVIVCAAVLGADLPKGRITDALVAVGNASYALYLTHALPVYVVASAMRMLDIEVNLRWPAYMTVALAASIGLAMLVYRYVELPITSLLKQYVVRRHRARHHRYRRRRPLVLPSQANRERHPEWGTSGQSS